MTFDTTPADARKIVIESLKKFYEKDPDFKELRRLYDEFRTYFFTHAAEDTINPPVYWPYDLTDK